MQMTFTSLVLLFLITPNFHTQCSEQIRKSSLKQLEEPQSFDNIETTLLCEKYELSDYKMSQKDRDTQLNRKERNKENREKGSMDRAY